MNLNHIFILQFERHKVMNDSAQLKIVLGMAM